VIACAREHGRDLVRAGLLHRKLELETIPRLRSIPEELRAAAPAILLEAAHALLRRRAAARRRLEILGFERGSDGPGALFDLRLRSPNDRSRRAATIGLRLRVAPASLVDVDATMKENVSTLHASGDDVEEPVRIDIVDDDLPPDPGIAIGEIRHPVDAVRASHEPEPVDDGASVPERALPVMGPIGLPGDDIFETVAVHVRVRDRMRLREDEPVAILV